MAGMGHCSSSSPHNAVIISAIVVPMSTMFSFLSFIVLLVVGTSLVIR